MTAVLLPNGKQQYLTTAGLPAVGYKVATFAAGTSTPQVTYQDALKVAQNTNPIILDGRGEASIFWEGAYKVQLQDSTGAPIWTQDNLQSQQNGLAASLVPAVTNSIDLGSASLSWRNLYLGPNNAPALDASSGNIGYIKQTQPESTASVTPTSFSYSASPAWVRRYGAILDGATNDRTALVSAIAVASTNPFTIVIDGPMAIATSITIPSNITVQFIGNGALKPTTGQTITFNGIVNASPGPIFLNALAAQGTVAFSTNKQRELFFEWWGAKGDSVTDDSAAMLACLTQASNAQATIRLVGNYSFATAMVQPTNVEIVGFGKDFGTQLTPTGTANWSFTGSSFQAAMRRVVISAAGTTNGNVLVLTGGCYRVTIEDVWLHNVQAVVNHNGILVQNCQNCVLNRVALDGSTTGFAGFTGILVQSGALGLQINAPDVEVFQAGISITGTAQCDIISPYAERCVNGISVTGTGTCNIIGGSFAVPTACIGISLASGSSGTTVIGPQFALTGTGTGVTVVGVAPLGALIIGVPAANISDPSSLLGKLNTVTPLTGWGTPAGPGVVTTFPGTPTLAQCGQAIGQIIVTLKSLGLYAA